MAREKEKLIKKNTLICESHIFTYCFFTHSVLLIMGVSIDWYEGEDSTKKGQTQWQPFSETTKYFSPSKKDFMINYRVKNLDAMVVDFKKNGVTIVDTIEKVSYGKFLHILDVEGNKVQLWEPMD